MRWLPYAATTPTRVAEASNTATTPSLDALKTATPTIPASNHGHSTRGAKPLGRPPVDIQQGGAPPPDQQQLDSPWASPLHMVKKVEGSWRSCCNYCHLNATMVLSTYRIPMMDFSTRAAGSRVFSKIDLRKGYHQIPMSLEDIPKT